MVKCDSCGFCEVYRQRDFDGDPLYKVGTCTQNPEKPKKINNVFSEIECKQFKERRTGWTTKDWHIWKDRHITLRRNTILTVIAVLISLGALAQPYIIPLITPEINLEFPYYPDILTGMENQPINSSFFIYNKGTEACFIEEIMALEVLEDNSWEFRELVSSGLIIEPKENEEITFQLSAQPANTSRMFKMIIFYGSGKYLFTPVGVASWWWKIGNMPLPSS